MCADLVLENNGKHRIFFFYKIRYSRTSPQPEVVCQTACYPLLIFLVGWACDRNRLLMGLYMETGRAKIDGVVNYVRTMCQGGGKFLVFAYHVEVLRAIQACVEKEAVSYIMIIGETPVFERQRYVRQFEDDPNCRVAILSLLAASQGLTLVSASTVLFAELHWTPGLIEQAEVGRSRALFLNRPCLKAPMGGVSL